jgi:outer membrane protein assembly factor BamE
MRILLFVPLVALAGCGVMDRVKEGVKNPLAQVRPYTLDIPQGNVIDQAMVDKLKPGMTRAQVRFVLGTPLLVDPFRSNRWDYAYSLKKSGQVVESRRITVVFDGEVLRAVEGDVVVATPVSATSAPAPVVQP